MTEQSGSQAAESARIPEAQGFLVLTRKIDQGVIVNGNVCILILGIERDRAKIGIRAPRNLTVLRDELLEFEKDFPESSSAPESSNEPDTYSPGMLILTRKIDQSFVIRELQMSVMVIGIERDRAKFGFLAPKNISILREELIDELDPNLIIAVKSAPARQIAYTAYPDTDQALQRQQAPKVEVQPAWRNFSDLALTNDAEFLLLKDSYDPQEAEIITGLNHADLLAITGASQRTETAYPRSIIEMLLKNPQVQAISQLEMRLSRSNRERVWARNRLVAALGNDLELYREASSELRASTLRSDGSRYNLNLPQALVFLRESDMRQIINWVKHYYPQQKIIDFIQG